MMHEIKTLFHNHWDPLLHGMDHRGLGFGGDLTLGFGWAIRDAITGTESITAVGLFRGEDDVESIEYDYPVGLAVGKATSVTEGDGFQDRKADQWYAYEARPINGAGVIGQPATRAVMMHTDGAGALEIIPNRPQWLSVERTAGAKARIVIGYAPDGQAIAPTDLQVFAKQLTDPEDTDRAGLYAAAETDDVTGLNYVPYVDGVTRYGFNLQAKAVGYWIFGAIFRDSGGNGDGGEVYSVIVQLTTDLPPSTLRFAVSEHDL